MRHIIDVKIPVYFMPGMAASSAIFEGLKLPENQFETHLLSWDIPERGIPLETYAKTFVKKIKHERPVLIGVSFGGLLVQEMAKYIDVHKLIIISSIKSKHELPKRMRFARYTQAHKLLPTGMVNNVELLAKYAFGESISKRLELYEKYLSVRDKYYIDWSIDNIVNWDRSTPDEKVIHIHGEKDPVFPIENINNCITVKNGTHTMIIHRARWFNENLPTIILE